MDRPTAKIAYQNAIQALDHLNALRGAIRVMRDGCGCSIPTNADGFIAQMHVWLLDETAVIEQELGLDIQQQGA